MTSPSGLRTTVQATQIRFWPGPACFNESSAARCRESARSGGCTSTAAGLSGSLSSVRRLQDLQRCFAEHRLVRGGEPAEMAESPAVRD